MRSLGVVCLAAALACSVEPGQSRPPPAAGAGVMLDPGSQTITLDPAHVPVLDDCFAGGLVRRTAAGWECALPEATTLQIIEIVDRLGALEASTEALARQVAALQTARASLEAYSDLAGQQIGALQSALAALQGSHAALQTLEATHFALDCPRGYAKDPRTDITLCRKTLTTGEIDEMVRVSDFWIDRYEATRCGSTDIGPASGHNVKAVACSRSGGSFLPGLDWFQGVQMCANAGKRMCTDLEWLTAAGGETDTGSDNGTNGKCVTGNSGIRATGLGYNCRSRYGVEDMVGNVWEMTGDWYQAGPDFNSADGVFVTWPSGLGSGVQNVNGRTVVNGTPAFWTSGLPSIGIHGGAANGWPTWDSVYGVSISYAPTFQFGGNVTMRCCISR